ncbi:ATP-grasp domain-containing protein [Streptosporangium soli]|nr:hypothetical protein [Streptosporangium sp. KLBMP 9127]
MIAAPYVVLAERADYGEFAALQSTLHRLGVPSVRLDAGSVATMEVTLQVGDGSVTLDGDRIAPTVVWARSLSPRAIPGEASPAVKTLHADSWCAFVRQLSTLSPASLPGPGPGRLEQLTSAAKAGIRTPRTIVTTDPRAAGARISSRRIVVKVLDEHFVETEPGFLVGVFPEIVDREEVVQWSPLDFPIIVQEYIAHDRELRVYYLAGAVHAFAVTKDAPDAPWRAESSVSVTSVTAPRTAVEVVRRLAGLWGLTYGAFDLLLTDGEVVFLEVNVDGDWRWFESKAGTPVVSIAAALMIRKLHLAALRHVTPTPPIDILDFLLLGTRTDRPGRSSVVTERCEIKEGA